MGKKELKTYEVIVTVDYVVMVDAVDEDEAQQLAYYQWRDDGDEVSSDVVNIEEIS